VRSRRAPSADFPKAVTGQAFQTLDRFDPLSIFQTLLALSWREC
jgi:hypothetical protein